MTALLVCNFAWSRLRTWRIKERTRITMFSSSFLYITNWRPRIYYDILKTSFSLPNTQALSEHSQSDGALPSLQDGYQGSLPSGTDNLVQSDPTSYKGWSVWLAASGRRDGKMVYHCWNQVTKKTATSVLGWLSCMHVLLTPFSLPSLESKLPCCEQPNGIELMLPITNHWEIIAGETTRQPHE